jgi:hypothetical protein
MQDGRTDVGREISNRALFRDVHQGVHLFANLKSVARGVSTHTAIAVQAGISNPPVLLLFRISLACFLQCASE